MESGPGETGASVGAAKADESVARRFSRTMNATTSRAGVLTDPPLVAAASGALLVLFLVALRADVGPVLARLLAALAAAPLVVAVSVAFALSGARKEVVGWLAEKPFPVENMNALLNGLGDVLEVRFVGALPGAASLNRALDAVHPDVFVVAESEETRTVDVRIGVVDSKRSPAGSNHARYVRVRRIVDEVLSPLSAACPIDRVRVR